MKKIYYILVAIVVIIFGYFIIKAIPEISNKLLVTGKYTFNQSSFSETGSFGFKSTPERYDLLKQMININSDFIKNPPIPFPDENNFEIKNFYKLEKFFTDYKYYYISQIKITNLLNNELPSFYSEIKSLSEEELSSYFNNNTEYLNKTWGIYELEQFINIVSTLKEINDQKVISTELSNSYFYLTNLNLLNFRIGLKLENSKKVYLSVEEYMYGINNDSQTPEIRFYGTVGGSSYV